MKIDLHGIMEYEDMVNITRYVNTSNDLLCPAVFKRNYKIIVQNLNCNQQLHFICSLPKCPDEKWLYFEDNCYYIPGSDQPRTTWSQSRENCMSIKGDLTSILSQRVVQFLMNKIPGMEEDLWTGLHVPPDKNKFEWSDGQLVIYENWSEGEPNDFGGEKCVSFISTTGKWNDINCSTKLRYVCKINIQPSTATTVNPQAVSSSTDSSQLGNCPQGWHKYREKCYKFAGNAIEDHKTWFEAHDVCKASGPVGNPDLASLHSEEDMMFMVRYLKPFDSPVWIGLHELNGWRFWAWSDNSNAKYFNWNTGEPSGDRWYGNPLGDTQENCVEMYTTTWFVGKWNNQDCLSRRPYVCQRDIDPTVVTEEPVEHCQQYPNFISYAGECYYYIPDLMTWDESVLKCKDLKADLANIMNVYEETFIHFTFKRNQTMWIGLNDKKKKGLYSWSNGWPITYTNWDSSKMSIGHACVAMLRNGKWIDAWCTQRLPALCKTSQVPYTTPEPVVDGHCPKESTNWISTERYCYLINWSVKEFAAARMDCVRRGGEIISLSTPEEAQRVLSMQKSVNNAGMWIGLIRTKDGVYRWIDGSPVTYTNWYGDEPSVFTKWGEEENCVTILNNGQWSDVVCTADFGYACKAEKVSANSVTSRISRNSIAGSEETLNFDAQEYETLKDNYGKATAGEIIGLIIGCLLCILVLGFIVIAQKGSFPRYMPKFLQEVGFENALYNAEEDHINIETTSGEF